MLVAQLDAAHRAASDALAEAALTNSKLAVCASKLAAANLRDIQRPSTAALIESTAVMAVSLVASVGEILSLSRALGMTAAAVVDIHGKALESASGGRKALD